MLRVFMLINIVFQGFMREFGLKGINGIRRAPQNTLLNTSRKGRTLKELLNQQPAVLRYKINV